MRDWLITARTKRGFTQKQMAEALNMSEPYYSLIENGKRQKKMEISLAINIGNVLGLSLEEIVGHEAKEVG